MDLSKAASILGKKGGQSTSPAKQAAVRLNGLKGGRPSKQPKTGLKYPKKKA